MIQRIGPIGMFIALTVLLLIGCSNKADPATGKATAKYLPTR